MKVNKKKLLIIGIVLVVLIVIVLIILNFNKKNETAALDIKTVKHDVVDKLYDEIDKSEDEKYVSKLFGYTSGEDGNIIMTVKEGYIENNKVYDLEGNELGDYTEDNLNSLLDKGTTKIYNYKKDNGEYILADK